MSLVVKIVTLGITGAVIMTLYLNNKYLRLKVDTLEKTNTKLVKANKDNDKICDLYKGALTNFMEDNNVTTEVNNTVIFNLDRVQ